LDPYCIVCIDFGAASGSIRFMCHIFINKPEFSWKHEGDCEDGTFEGDSDLGMGLPRKRIVKIRFFKTSTSDAQNECEST